MTEMEELKKELKIILRSYGHRYYGIVRNHKDDDGLMEKFFNEIDEIMISRIQQKIKEAKISQMEFILSEFDRLKKESHRSTNYIWTFADAIFIIGTMLDNIKVKKC